MTQSPGTVRGNHAGHVDQGSLWKRLKPDNFVLLLLGVVLLARFYPEPGLVEGQFSLSRVTSLGVTLIFFFYGMRLSPGKFAAGLTRFKLHFLIQAATFLLFPLLVLGCMTLLGSGANRYLWLGIFFLAALPSTVSSSIVMVSIAGGNLPVAIFNASISSLLGVFLTPLWMRLFLDTSGTGFDISGVVVKLALQILLPLTAGMLLNRKLGAWAEAKKGWLRIFDQTVILAVVYTSFCESFAGNLFSGIGISELVLLTAAMLILFFVVFFFLKAVCRLLGFDRQETITVLFCGSKKSLVHGTVLSKVLFANSSFIGIVLLPLMLYHALQIIVASMIAQKMATRT